MSGLIKRVRCRSYSTAAADAVAQELRLSPVTAAILARRGHDTPRAAASFLAADERHDPFAFASMRAACELVLSHVERGGRIVVHGDYDVDGVCSTALLVGTLRELGADPAWHLPSRFDEGYGLSLRTVERLVASGTTLLITVDCGITAVEEVAAARAAGLDVLVTDHHLPGPRLPQAPILHPALDGYPFSELCATGVVHKLAEGLYASAGRDPRLVDRELDLVGLATVADLVPLQGENRRLVREGIAALARTRRPGLRALMAVARVERGRVDESTVGFRLAPRMNAAGRLQRADAALELLLTEDVTRAVEVADELDLLNRERRDTETRILFEAEAARAEHAESPAYVLAGDGWHPGVIGIVASRLVERHHRPCVLIALDGDGGQGSARSIPAYDLHAGLGACAQHLRRFGGHAMAAGLELDRAAVGPLREALAGHAATVLTPGDLEPAERVDGLVGVDSLRLGLAEELARLAPFGQGNPAPTLLVPSARVCDVRSMGEEEQHSGFSLSGGGARARGVAFRTQARSLAAAGAAPLHVAVRLEANEWKGAVEPRVVLRALVDAAQPSSCAVVGEEPWVVALGRERVGAPRRSAPAADACRAVRDRRGQGFAGLAGQLLSSGEHVLVVCAHLARRREALVELLGGLAHVFGSEPQGAALCSWDDLGRDPALAAGFQHVLALDPPSGRWGEDLLGSLPSRAPDSFSHLAWGPVEAGFALAVAESELDLRGPLTQLYRQLRDEGACSGERLQVILQGQARYPRSPALCARLVRVLEQLGLVAYHQEGPSGPSCLVLDAPRTSLDRSPEAVACAERLAGVRRYLAGQGAVVAPQAPREPAPAMPVAA